MCNLWWTLVTGFPQQQPVSGHVQFVVDKVALGQVFSKYFGFSCHSTICSTLTIIIHHLQLVQ
jgi:hypothetical protein